MGLIKYRCGKSEIAKELSKRIKIPYFKNKNEKDFVNIKDAYYYDFKYAQDFITQFLEQTKQSVIFDRSWLSQRVYSLLTGRKWSLEDWFKIDQVYGNLGAKIIFCNRSSYKDSIDDIWTSEEIERQHTLYLQTLALTNCEYLDLNVDDENIEREINEIMGFIK